MSVRRFMLSFLFISHFSIARRFGLGKLESASKLDLLV